MKKTITISTLAAIVMAGAVMLFAGIAAPSSNATTGYCHTTALSIAVPASAVAGRTIAVTGSEARTPEHPVKVTLQSRLSTSSTWVNKASTRLSGRSYSVKWKAPVKKGKYKIRVRITYLSASHTSAVRTVTVK